jgi:superoxide reductase
MCNQKFYICKHCGNLIGMLHDGGVPMICCGEPMSELVANTVDASKEKHVPEVTVSGNNVEVKIGSAPHPMTEEHSIQWVYLQTQKGGQRKCLKPSDEPKATFAVTDDKPEAVFAYCNLHGLWKTEI